MNAWPRFRHRLDALFRKRDLDADIVVNGILLRPLSFPERDRLIIPWESNPAQGIGQQNVSPAHRASHVDPLEALPCD